MKPLLDALDERVLICDGAMGTMLYSKGIFLNRSFDEMNLTQPNLVLDVHQAYVRAGADILETNTFGANHVKLATFGLAEQLHAINVQGVRIARQAARDQAYVAGAIGPLGIRVEPWGKTGLDEAEGYFLEQAQALVDGGVDLFMLETFRDLSELGAAIRAVRRVSTLPIVAQLTTGEDGHSLDGAPPEQFTAVLASLGADVIGLNCSVGPAVMLETLEQMAERTSARLSAQPNAGRPRDVEGRNIYLSSPEYMASYARRFIATGVRIVGGCCGTTPEHIRHIKMAARSLSPAVSSAARVRPQSTAVGQTPEVMLVDRRDKSRLANALACGRFVTAVELAPPRGYSCDTLIEQARLLRIRGVDAIVIADRTGGGGRMSALAVAVLVEQQAGIETVLRYSCRDHRLVAMQADLLGAHGMGLRNLLVVTGEPKHHGDYPDATSVFEVDSIGLTNAVSSLNRALDIGGQAIGKPTAFHIGVRVNPSSLTLDDEVRRFEFKADAGAEFVVTAPVFDPGDLEAFLGRMGGAGLPVIVTVCPFESLRHAEWLANEVPNVRVPDTLIDRMRQADQQGTAAEEGVAIAQELARAVRPLAQGIHVSAPSRRADVALRVLDALMPTSAQA